MPFLNQFPTSPTEWRDPDSMPCRVFTVGMAMETTVRFELDFHRHRKGQFILCQQGILKCEAEDCFWTVPPHNALWVPGDTLHAVEFSGAVEGYNAFVDPACTTCLPSTCCTLSVTPLLRELLIRSAGLPDHYPDDGAESHLVTLLLDEIAAARVGDLHLPVPADRRLRKVLDTMLANPSRHGTITTWARRVGLSERTMSRLLMRETGMSFGRWRRQLHIMLALQKLAKGVSIQQVAMDLGYESVSSFSTMFRKALGAPPGRYMAEQHVVPLR